ncbi:MAG TPA: 3-methyl-2-oxobutanoate hydroxymethyltransferase [Candidatus Stackebrandtia faecavium]|nr:3-methyl-2-oxobutanoate hydroxymethyltransferase [Candidatus Stackebrandtia faecavium]
MSVPSEVPSLYGPARKTSRIRTRDLMRAKERGEKFAMLTSYDRYTAAIFDEAGIPALLVGDSAANNVYGYESTIPVTVEELLPLVGAVARSTKRTLVVADLPFGSYEVSSQQAHETAVRFMKQGAHAVKLEGGVSVAEQIRTLTTAGVPVLAHIGFTPQSEHQVGGYRVAGRAEQARKVLEDAVAVAEAGAFGVVLEMVTADVAAQVTKEVPIPTIGIGAGAQTDGQIMVWQDIAGLNTGSTPRFVKRYGNVAEVISRVATQYADEVRDGIFPASEHEFS